MEIQKLRNAIKSINEDFCTKNDFRNEEVLEHNGLYYNVDEWVILHNGEICINDEAMYCDYNDEYYYYEDVAEVQIYKATYYYSINALNRLGLIYFEGIYYDQDALDYEDIHYLEDLQEYSNTNCYYHNNEDAYYSYPEEENESYTRSYHNGSYKLKMFDDVSEYKIGYEIEKEDLNTLQSINIDNFENETNYLWRKETDGSLSDCNGFELISPTFELDTEKIFELINSNPILINHINSSISPRCGGHINLSKKDKTGHDVFNMVCGYTPLLYSLYYGRVDKTYSKGKSNKDLQCENEKYQAIRIHDNRIEFRIISAVPNVQTLLWRTKLIEKMLQYPTSDVRTAYWHIKTKFKTLLSEVYNPTKIQILNERIVNNTLKFEGVDLTKTRKNDNNNNDKN
jgi:hypothetical protein